MDNSGLIYCIGDSHASFFSGYDEIQPCFPEKSRNKYSFLASYRLGAVLAYNLHKFNTKEKGREKLFELLSEIKKGSKLLLCFGEIDCRCHLIAQSKNQNSNIEETVHDCVNKYAIVLDELQSLNFNISVWAAIPSAQSFNVEYPSFGTQYERNVCTNLFNQYLKLECDKRRINFISINKFLIKKSLETKFNYFFDSIHLGQIALPFALRELKKSGFIGEVIPYSDLHIKLKVAFTKMKYYSLSFQKKLKERLKKVFKKTI